MIHRPTFVLPCVQERGIQTALFTVFFSWLLFLRLFLLQSIIWYQHQQNPAFVNWLMLSFSIRSRLRGWWLGSPTVSHWPPASYWSEGVPDLGMPGFCGAAPVMQAADTSLKAHKTSVQAFVLMPEVLWNSWLAATDRSVISLASELFCELEASCGKAFLELILYDSVGLSSLHCRSWRKCLGKKIAKGL